MGGIITLNGLGTAQPAYLKNEKGKKSLLLLCGSAADKSMAISAMTFVMFKEHLVCFNFSTARLLICFILFKLHLSNLFKCLTLLEVVIEPNKQPPESTQAIKSQKIAESDKPPPESALVIESSANNELDKKSSKSHSDIESKIIVASNKKSSSSEALKPHSEKSTELLSAIKSQKTAESNDQPSESTLVIESQKTAKSNKFLSKSLSAIESKKIIDSNRNLRRSPSDINLQSTTNARQNVQRPNLKDGKHQKLLKDKSGICYCLTECGSDENSCLFHSLCYLCRNGRMNQHSELRKDLRDYAMENAEKLPNYIMHEMASACSSIIVAQWEERTKGTTAELELKKEIVSRYTQQITNCMGKQGTSVDIMLASLYFNIPIAEICPETETFTLYFPMKTSDGKLAIEMACLPSQFSEDNFSKSAAIAELRDCIKSWENLHSKLIEQDIKVSTFPEILDGNDYDDIKSLNDCRGEIINVIYGILIKSGAIGVRNQLNFHWQAVTFFEEKNLEQIKKTTQIEKLSDEVSASTSNVINASLLEKNPYDELFELVKFIVESSKKELGTIELAVDAIRNIVVSDDDFSKDILLNILGILDVKEDEFNKFYDANKDTFNRCFNEICLSIAAQKASVRNKRAIKELASSLHSLYISAGFKKDDNNASVIAGVINGIISNADNSTEIFINSLESLTFDDPAKIIPYNNRVLLIGLKKAFLTYRLKLLNSDYRILYNQIIKEITNQMTKESSANAQKYDNCFFIQNFALNLLKFCTDLNSKCDFATIKTFFDPTITSLFEWDVQQSNELFEKIAKSFTPTSVNRKSFSGIFSKFEEDLSDELWVRLTKSTQGNPISQFVFDELKPLLQEISPDSTCCDEYFKKLIMDIVTDISSQIAFNELLNSTHTMPEAQKAEYTNRYIKIICRLKKILVTNYH
ncbi:MAG: hypothetical protein LBI69_04895 [Puniceicoccales bacterium]|jgi:hypothetical protein|nr:hypothetical protein [Puniceicoccales bacterium]